jgi:hypothetical protein
MNKYETYRLKIQHCREMAQRSIGPLEKECWLIVADSWTRLLHMIEPPNDQSVQLVPEQAESSHPNEVYSFSAKLRKLLSIFFDRASDAALRAAG